MAILVPQFSGYDPYSFGQAETFSYVPIANDQNRPLYAKASYITNFDDLHISLSAGNLDIGAVHLLDFNNGLYASIANVGLGGLDSGKGAVRVLTQDFESTVDNIAIGDANGNQAVVNSRLSALNVSVVNSVTNWDVLSAAINASTYTTLPSNPANEITILNNTGGTMYIKNASKSIGLSLIHISEPTRPY